MAFNKNSNGYTFIFAIVMVVMVGAILASLSLSLKPMQKANEAEKKMMNILGAIGVPSGIVLMKVPKPCRIIAGPLSFARAEGYGVCVVD